MLAFHWAAPRQASGDAHCEYRCDGPVGRVVSGHNQVSAEAAANAVLQQLKISARAKVQRAQNTRAGRTAAGSGSGAAPRPRARCPDRELTCRTVTTIRMRTDRVSGSGRHRPWVCSRISSKGARRGIPRARPDGADRPPRLAPRREGTCESIPRRLVSGGVAAGRVPPLG
jgi:hypothetical protein